MTMKLQSITLLTAILLPGCHLFQTKTAQTKVNTFGTQNNEYRSEGNLLSTHSFKGTVFEAAAKAEKYLGKSCEVKIESFSGKADNEGGALNPQIDVSVTVEGLSAPLIQRGLQQANRYDEAQELTFWSPTEERISKQPLGSEPYVIVVQSSGQSVEKASSATVSTEDSSSADSSFLLTCQVDSEDTEDEQLALIQIQNTSVRGNPITLIGVEDNEASCQGGNPKYKSVGTLELEVPLSVTKIGICGMPGGGHNGGHNGGHDFKIIDVSGKLKAGEVLVIKNDSVE